MVSIVKVKIKWQSFEEIHKDDAFVPGFYILQTLILKSSVQGIIERSKIGRDFIVLVPNGSRNNSETHAQNGRGITILKPSMKVTRNSFSISA